MVYGYVLRLTDNLILLYRGEQRRMLYQNQKIGQLKNYYSLVLFPLVVVPYGDMLCCSSILK